MSLQNYSGYQRQTPCSAGKHFLEISTALVVYKKMDERKQNRPWSSPLSCDGMVRTIAMESDGLTRGMQFWTQAVQSPYQVKKLLGRVFNVLGDTSWLDVLRWRRVSQFIRKLQLLMNCLPHLKFWNRDCCYRPSWPLTLKLRESWTLLVVLELVKLSWPKNWTGYMPNTVVFQCLPVLGNVLLVKRSGDEKRTKDSLQRLSR